MKYLIGLLMVIVLSLAFFVVPPLLSAAETLSVILGFILAVVLWVAWAYLSLKVLQRMVNW